jgi:hypothetical protein
LVRPVTFAPGRLRLSTRPNATGSPPVLKTTGMVVVAAFAQAAVLRPERLGCWAGTVEPCECATVQPLTNG